MRRSGFISILALAAASGGLAFAQEPSAETERAERGSELPSSLDRFVENAIAEGLLTPTQPSGEASAAVDLKPPTAEATPQIAPISPVSLRPKQAVAETVCGDRDPFDFSEYHELRTYDDLLAWRTNTEAGQPEELKAQLARAYIALGLNEEARLQLNGVVGAEASALRRLAYMMEDRGAPDVDYFRQQAACPDASGIWYSLALFATDREEAARRFDARISEFRRLPFQLRVEIAAVAVPALDASDARLVAEKLMANFDERDIASSSRLVFNKALLAMHSGGEPARNVMRNYLNRPEFRDDAAAALLRHGQRLDKTVKEDVAARMIEQIGQTERAGPVSNNLDVMLTDLHEVAGYGLTLQLASMPATQSPEAQDKIVTHYVALADTGLDSASVLKNLEAMDAVLAGAPMLEAHDDGERLFAAASKRAVDLGLQNLAAIFAARSNDPEELAEARAMLAFRMLDHEALISFSEQHPSNQEIARLAALSAVRIGDRSLLTRMEPKLEADARTLVALIEMDAVSRHWMVPDRIYQAARGLDDAEAKARVRRVSTLRNDLGREKKTPRYAVADVNRALSAIRQSLDPKTGETH